MNLTMSGDKIETFEGAVEELREALKLLERDRIERLTQTQAYHDMVKELAQYREQEQRKKALENATSV